MKKLLFLLFAFPLLSYGQLDYPNYSSLLKNINELATHRYASKALIGKSYGGEDIPVIKIQTDQQAKPTLLIVAGIDGQHPVGIINAINVIKNILALPPDSLQHLLATKSIWIVPILNPDAYKRNSNALIWQSGNARQIDNDRDGRVDEDPLKDLNNDGIISQMRIKSPAGQYKSHGDYSDYLILAEKNKNETGVYELYTEGIDADQDGLYGEDGLSGVNIDRNFTFDYPFFEQETGEYAASEPETRAIIDFIFDHPQIATVLHFGLQNNLSHAENFDPGRASQRITKSWTKADTEVSNFVSQLYNKATKPLGEAPKLQTGKGNFSSTVYYHTGKFSFVTPTWWVPTIQDTTKQGAAAKGDTDKFLKWVTTNQIQGAILPWTKVNHPNFPNQEVEVGGVVDIFRNNPPIQHLEESTSLHTDFVVQLVNAMASLHFSEPKVTSLGDDIYRVELRVFNTGALPIYPELADRIKHVSKLRSIMELQNGQQFLSGKRLQLHGSLGAGKSQDFSWLIKGKGKVQVVVGCPTAGEKTIDITL